MANVTEAPKQAINFLQNKTLAAVLLILATGAATAWALRNHRDKLARVPVVNKILGV